MTREWMGFWVAFYRQRGEWQLLKSFHRSSQDAYATVQLEGVKGSENIFVHFLKLENDKSEPMVSYWSELFDRFPYLSHILEDFRLLAYRGLEYVERENRIIRFNNERKLNESIRRRTEKSRKT